MALYMSNICRLCMARKDVLIPLFSNDNRGQTLSLPDKIMNFVPIIKLFVGDGLPAQICEPCVRLVNTSYKFKVQCETTDTALRQYLSTHSLQESTDEILHSVFRTDSIEDCWKLAAVKDEVVEVSIEEPDTDIEDDEDERLHGETDVLSEHDDVWSHMQPISKTVKMQRSDEQQAGPSVKKTSLKPKNLPDCLNSTSDRKTDADVKLQMGLGTSSVTHPEVGDPDSCASVCSAVDMVQLERDGNSLKVGSNTKTKVYKKNIVCPECGKTFSQKHQLALHMTSHSGEKPYDCTECGKKFARRRQLTVHMFTHTGEKPFLCPICGESFGRSDTLTKHMRSHTGEKPFHCAVCGNNFGRRSTLTNHMRAHMGEKPYLCTECGWRFVQSYDLTKHMRSHTGEKPFQCTMCRMSFGQRNSLTKHMRSHTGEASFSVELAKGLQYTNYTSSTLN
ncbi:zinc finger protein 37 homolog isoform X2 [Zootermopsis nevadensis]|uniref:zinc finger protein 37 homolog isoform X2 n=1 Tax=Zootermopsis nevadensis TaxID=136037 RepID=UPI000B8EAC73|nr:zinc finger protein 37 homolog isoform X2 [Zootermopsis nevadensis]